jgi:dCTP deaminase
MSDDKHTYSGLICKSELIELTKSEELVITPLLEETQIGAISVDLRVGTDFLALKQGRDEFIDTTNNDTNTRPIKGHFSESRRRLGESFLLHSGQIILFSTLEYLKLPENVYADLSLRSSYSRIGLNLSTIIQPGYCGCASIELVNSSNTTIKILSGARLIQARFYRIPDGQKYFNKKRKYNCQVRPVSSKANEDNELSILEGLNKS